MSKLLKSFMVSEYKAAFDGVTSCILVDVSPLNVGEVQDFRNHLRESNIGLRVIRNRLAYYAVEGSPLEPVRDMFSGQTAIAYSPEDAEGISTAKAIVGFLTKNKAMKFKRGAIGYHLHSYSAKTLRYPGGHWVGPILERGACGSIGYVYEPYLAFTIQIDLFNARLMAGYTLAEAAHMASPTLSWTMTVVGDPLYRPFSPATDLGAVKGDEDYKAYRLAQMRWYKPEQLFRSG